MENFISGVYNYCDRWCERCPLTHRCRIFEASNESTNSGDPHFDAEAFSDSLADNLEKAVEMIRESVEKQGLDWGKFHEEAVQMEMIEPELTLMEVAVKDRAIKYGMEVKKWFEQNEDWLKEKEVELNQKTRLGLDQDAIFASLSDALAVIQWYNFFIGPKISRAIRGLHTAVPQADPIQTDANGTAKIALLAIDSSINAWEIIRSHFPERTDDLLDLFRLLAWLRRETRNLFPHAEEFVRPGFDEVSKKVLIN